MQDASLIDDNAPPLNVHELVAAMQYLPMGITIIDRALTMRFWNDAFCQILDFPKDIMRPGVSLEQLFYFNALRGEFGPGDPAELVGARLDIVRQFVPHRFTRVRGNGVILDVTGRVIYDEDGVFGFVTIYQDISQEKRREHQLQAANKELQQAYEELKLAQMNNTALQEDRQKYYQMAVRDQVTHLFTRYYMEDAASRLIEQHERNIASKLSLLIFDIDHFKSINDTYGHLYGDIVLRQVGALLLQQSRRIDVAVRLGGDEFAVFLSGIDEDECLAFFERLRHAISVSKFDGVLAGLVLTLSAGIATHHVGETLEEMLHRADTALYEAKRAGRNCVRRAQ
ncbi:MAG: diguanylate cyclase [Burkholderiales bacterium]|nr:diguanylate cyclase [Burkholderiales bacterium]